MQDHFLSVLRGKILSAVPAVLFDWGFFGIWKRVPQRIRRKLVDFVTRVRVERGDYPRSAEGPFVVCGLATSHTSFGWALRGTMSYLAAQGEEATAVDISRYFWAGDQSTSGVGQADPEILEERGTLILHVNPDQLLYALSILPAVVLRSKYIVEYLVWEFERIPDGWRPALDLVDELWVPSHFVRDALIASDIQKPIRVIPHVLEIPREIRGARSQFDLPENAFLVLSAFNIRSGLDRKNVLGNIAAFRAAFAAEPRALLILKCHDIHVEPKMLNIVQRAGADLTNIRILTDDLSDIDMWSLIAACDCVLSLHRSEGYGLILKQGLMLNKPVIATGWSGNADFMIDSQGHAVRNALLVPFELVAATNPSGMFGVPYGAQWADASVPEAARILQKQFQHWTMTNCPT